MRTGSYSLLTAPPRSQSHGLQPSMSLLSPQCSGCGTHTQSHTHTAYTHTHTHTRAQTSTHSVKTENRVLKEASLETSHHVLQLCWETRVSLSHPAGCLMPRTFMTLVGLKSSEPENLLLHLQPAKPYNLYLCVCSSVWEGVLG